MSHVAKYCCFVQHCMVTIGSTQTWEVKMQRLETTAKFNCPLCHKDATAKIEVPEPNWGASDKMSELTSESETEVTCNQCEVTFTAYVQNSASDCTVTLDEYPDVEVIADNAFFSPSEDDDWLNTDLPEHPAGIFMDSHHHSGDILAEYGVGGTGVLSHSAFIINRMVFAQQVSALEAYLGDTLVQQVMFSQEAMDRILDKEEELKDVKIGLADIVKSPNIVRETVRAHLQGILYHNLAKVAVLYKIALKINIWPNDDIKKSLFRAVQYRHDCVHRNGRDKDGTELTVFTTEYVTSMLEAMRTLVQHIEVALIPEVP